MTDRDLQADADTAEMSNARRESMLNELANLSPIEYDLRRLKAALDLHIRVTTLDDQVERLRGSPSRESRPTQGRTLKLPEPVPWGQPIEGSGLLDEIAAAIRRYVVLPQYAAEAIALWVVQSHALSSADITPRLAILSPQKRCGKTTLLDVLFSLVPRPLPTANVTVAAVFRTIEQARPVLLIDEADNFLGRDELLGILNSGHRRGGTVIRTIGNEYEPRQFSTFAPIAIAAIGKLPDTLYDRSIVIHMVRRRSDERVARLRPGRTPDLEVLSQKAARFAADHAAALAAAEPKGLEGLNDRALDNWRILLAIADVAGGHWPRTARGAALALSGAEGPEDDSLSVQLLADIRKVFEDSRADRLASKVMVDALIAMSDRPWAVWRGGIPLGQHALARLLRPYGISPHSTRVGDATPKGYLRSQFADAWTRYLSDECCDQTATPPHIRDSADLSDDQSATHRDNVSEENRLETNNPAGCGGVAVKTRIIETEDEYNLEIPAFLDRRRRPGGATRADGSDLTRNV